MIAAVETATREIPLDDVLRFMRLIWAIDHELERVSKRMEARIGLTIPQRLTLLLIGQNPGILASELAEVLHLHRGTLSGILRRLEHAGYIERTVDAARRAPRRPDADAVRAGVESAPRRHVRGRGAPHAGVGPRRPNAPRPSTCCRALAPSCAPSATPARSRGLLHVQQLDVEDQRGVGRNGGAGCR